MVKYNQTIRQQKPTNCLSVFNHFLEFALKGLKSYHFRQILSPPNFVLIFFLQNSCYNSLIEFWVKFLWWQINLEFNIGNFDLLQNILLSFIRLCTNVASHIEQIFNFYYPWNN